MKQLVEASINKKSDMTIFLQKLLNIVAKKELGKITVDTKYDKQ
jgi:hypothetical protein